MSWHAYVRPLAPVDQDVLFVLGRFAADIDQAAPFDRVEYGYRHVPCGARAAVSLHYRGYDEEEADDHPGWAIFVSVDMHPSMVDDVETIVWNLMEELAFADVPSEWYDPQADVWSTEPPRVEAK